ncbi:uncharacterized protein LOC112165132 isoform X2 [Rosa chinensis]|uniref:uncharacterized protein LOC112165132 isoform X2 n=1 Tax=Rosa chinensis TaxID=74649 RepID=UPI001AD8FC83|nr:uncharacterized protein LOC112165132 isoform X2 [Rosa chinensis]
MSKGFNHAGWIVTTSIRSPDQRKRKMSLTNEGASKKKADSDSEEDNNLKEKGVSNKKKEGFCSFLFRLMPMWSFFQLQRRMKIAELKKLCDVVEGKCGTGKQPFQLPDFIAATGIEKIRQEEPVDKTKHWGDLEREEEEEEPMEGKDLEDGIESVDSLSSTPTGNEKPDVIDLHKQQRKEPERPLYQKAYKVDVTTT